MAAYIHGNLATQERYEQKNNNVNRETRRVVRVKHRLSAREKLLYLFTILICVVATGTIIYHYAQIYEVNTKIQNIEKEIAILEQENQSLMLTVRKLQDPKRLNEIGVQMGFVPVEEVKISQFVAPAITPASQGTKVVVAD